MEVYVRKYVQFARTAVYKKHIRSPLELSPQKTSCKKKDRKLVSGILFESGGWSSDEDNAAGNMVTLEEYYEDEALRVFKS